MASRNPLWTQGGSTSAEEDRALIAGLYVGGGSGVLGISGADLKVTQHGTPNMSVDVAAGRAAILGTENALQGYYNGWLDASANVVIAASDPTNPRIDLVVLRVKDAFYSGATNAFSVEAVTGTPAGSPAAPAAPANSFTLAQISVAALATTVVTANIADKRVWTGVKPWNLPWGEVSGKFTSANQGPVAVETDATTLTTGTITYVANRSYEVTFGGELSESGASLWLTDGANTHLSRIVAQGGTFGGSMTYKEVGVGAGTRKLRIGPVSSCTLRNSTAPGFISVKDVGPSGPTPA